MATDYHHDGAEAGARRGRPWLRALIVLLVGFAAGTFLTGYALTHWEVAGRFLKTRAAAAPPARIVSPLPRIVVAPPAAASPAEAAAIDQRIARVEARVAQIDARAQAAAGNADRAEGLLVVFAARRAIDRGVALGYMETLLRERFGGSQPQAVAAIIGAAQQPVTLGALQTALDGAAPALMTRSSRESWWAGLRRELGDLIVLRRADMPSPAPQDRLARARGELQSGQVEAALAEVARMPGRAGAAAWITLARRYVAARRALDAIETAALLAPHGDEGAGNPAPRWPAPIEPAPGA